MGALLSGGVVKGDRLVCPLHGKSMGQTGCVRRFQPLKLFLILPDSAAILWKSGVGICSFSIALKRDSRFLFLRENHLKNFCLPNRSNWLRKRPGISLARMDLIYNIFEWPTIEGCWAHRKFPVPHLSHAAFVATFEVSGMSLKRPIDALYRRSTCYHGCHSLGWQFDFGSRCICTNNQLRDF